MDDGKSTNDIRMIATDVVAQQERVCQAERGALSDKLSDLADTVKANTTAIAALTANVATLTATVTPICKTVDTNEINISNLKESVTKLNTRPAIWAVLGSLVGSVVVPLGQLLIHWIEKP